MKKTTIIIICVVYLLSIVAVQFFGVPVTVPEAGEYITSIKITDVTLNNRGNGQSDTMLNGTNKNGVWYRFSFIPSEDEPYTADTENLSKNPNRVKIDYAIEPVTASQGAIKITVSGVVLGEDVVLLEKTEEFSYELVFLRSGLAPTVMIYEDKGSQAMKDSVTIFGL